MAKKGRDRRGLQHMEANMHTTFNSASLVKLSKSKLFALLAEYRALLARSDKQELPAIRSEIAKIEQALTYRSGP